MLRWGLGVLAGLVFITWLAWSAGSKAVREPPPEPTQADRIMDYCREKGHAKSPLCVINPEDAKAVDKAVRDAIAQTPNAPAQIIERQREVVRDDDDDDPAPARPRVQVNMPPPSANPTSPTQTPQPTRAPQLIPEVELPREIKVPNGPEVKLPNLSGPLLP